MTKDDFLQQLTSMSIEEINRVIHENGKKKEPTSVELPFDIII